jgi:hypothetical protein
VPSIGSIPIKSSSRSSPSCCSRSEPIPTGGDSTRRWPAGTGPSLAGLVEHVAEAIERYRAGELEVHDVDEVIHRHHEATQELWKFCFLGGSGAGAESVAATLQDLTAEDGRPDWWAAAERRRG